MIKWGNNSLDRAPGVLRSIVTLTLLGVVVALAACSTQREVTEKYQLVWPAPPDPPRYYFERSIVASTDIADETMAQRLQRIATGEDPRAMGLDKPFGICAVDGRIFVGDTVGRRVMVYDIPGKHFYVFGNSGPGILAKPLGMAIDGHDRVYVIDATDKKVKVYDLEGKYITAIGNPTMFDRPSGVAVNRDGSRVYVVDTGGVKSRNHRVRVFDGRTGQHLFDFGKRGTEPGEFNLPNMATTDPEGNVYVTDGGNFRIEKFSPDGKFLMSVGAVGRQPGQFSRPKGVAVDKDGKIFVVDAAFGNFQIFDKKGELLMHVGERNSKGGPGRYLLPAGIAVDNDGRVYFVDQFFRKIEVYRPANVPAGRIERATAALKP